MKISICIPTYNYAQFISQTIKSILDQKIDSSIYEIVVGDSSNNNKTFKIINKFKKIKKNIIYKKFKKKEGIDIDLEKTTQLCRGEYIVFLSSDDCLVPGSINLILKNLESKNSVYLFNRIICDKNLKIKKKSNWLNGSVGNKVFLFYCYKSLNYYLKNSNSIGALFSYMSCIIVKKKLYKQVSIKKKFIGTNYLHVQKILDILFDNKSSLKYLKDYLVFFRGDNDSFKKDGYLNRIIMDFYGYQLFFIRYFANSKSSNHFLKLMRKEHKFYFLIRVGEYLRSKNEWTNLKNYLKFFKYNLLQIYFIKILGKSIFLILILRRMKKFFGI